MADKDVRFSIRAKDKTRSAFESVKNSLGGVSTIVAGLGVAATAAFGIIAAKVLDVGDRVHKLSLKLGVSTESLSQLRHAADLSGVSFESLSKGLEKMQLNVADAADDMGVAKGALEAIGIDAATLKSLKPEDQFEAIADAMEKVSSHGDKVRYAADIFGGRGVEMLQIMEGGGDAIRKMRKEADDLGMSLSGQGATNIANFNDSVTRVQGAITGMVQTVVGKASPALTSFFDWMADRIPEAAGWAGEAITKWGESLLATFDRIEIWYYMNEETVKSWWNTTKDSFVLVGSIVSTIAKGFLAVGEAIGKYMAKVAEFVDKVMELDGVKAVLELFVKKSPVKPFTEGMMEATAIFDKFTKGINSSRMKPIVDLSGFTGMMDGLSDVFAKQVQRVVDFKTVAVARGKEASPYSQAEKQRAHNMYEGAQAGLSELIEIMKQFQGGTTIAPTYVTTPAIAREIDQELETVAVRYGAKMVAGI